MRVVVPVLGRESCFRRLSSAMAGRIVSQPEPWREPPAPTVVAAMDIALTSLERQPARLPLPQVEQPDDPIRKDLAELDMDRRGNQTSGMFADFASARAEIAALKAENSALKAGNALSLPNCFDACDSCGLHAHGEWIWAGEPGSCSEWHPDSGVSCCATQRPKYEWRPFRCSVRPFAVERVCSLLEGNSVLFVGDSTMNQLYQSFVHLSNGTFDRSSNPKRPASPGTATACDNRVRFQFLRNDLCLWSKYGHDANTAFECDR